MSGVRVDKWLWSVRIFKSRTIASEHCKTRVRINGIKTKPSSQVKIGDVVEVSKNGYHFKFEVEQLLEKRVGAPLAQLAYKDITPQEELDKFEQWYIGKARAEMRERGTGRPTKRDRRDLEGFKDEYFYFTEE